MLPGFPNATPAKRKSHRKRWKDGNRILEWDYQHGTIEKFTKNGDHLGEYDPDTGLQIKPANPSRDINPSIKEN